MGVRRVDGSDGGDDALSLLEIIFLGRFEAFTERGLSVGERQDGDGKEEGHSTINRRARESR
ncbi:hypothetical protein THAOC_36867, partial [Thalassiosira oceanica]